LRAGILRGLRNRFLRDTANLHVAATIGLVSQLVSAVALAHILGAEGQGLYLSSMALAAFGYYLLNFGVPQATASQIAASAARGNTLKIAAWAAFLIQVHLGFCTLLLVLGAIFFPLVAEHFLDEGSVGVWAVWLCAAPLLELPRVVVQVLLQGTRHMRAYGRVENGFELVRAFLVVTGALVTGSPAGVVVGHLTAGALGSVLALATYAETRAGAVEVLPGISLIAGQMRGIPLRRGLRQGLRLSVVKNSHTIFCNVLPRLLLQGLAGASWVAYFHIAERLISVPMLLGRSVARAALPALAEIAGRRDGVAYRRAFVRVSLTAGSLITLAILVVLPILPHFMRALFPPRFVEPVALFYGILAFGYIPSAFAVGLEAFYVTVNRLRAMFGLTLVGALLLIPANVWLVLNVEITGAAWGLVLYQAWGLVQVGYAGLFFWRTRRDPNYWS